MLHLYIFNIIFFYFIVLISRSRNHTCSLPHSVYPGFPNLCDSWSLIVSCSSSVSLQGFQWRRMRRISTRLLKLVCSLSSTRSKVNRRDRSASPQRKSRALPVSESFSPVLYVKHHMCFQRIRIEMMFMTIKHLSVQFS